MKKKITFKNTVLLINLKSFFTFLIITSGSVAHSQTYCTPGLDCSDDDMILNVTIATINNTTTCGAGGYNNFTAQPAPTLITGTSYPISVTVGDGWSNEAVSVWIDYDSNGTFEQSEFTFIGVGSGSVVSGSVAIPAAATAGNKRMRVRVAAVGATSATWDMSCDEDDEYGETEDYTVNIQATGSVNEFSAQSLTVFKSNNVFTINSSAQLIDNVEVYDVSGKLIYASAGINSNLFDVDASGFKSQLLLLKVKTVDGVIHNKKMMN